VSEPSRARRSSLVSRSTPILVLASALACLASLLFPGGRAHLRVHIVDVSPSVGSDPAEIVEREARRFLDPRSDPCEAAMVVMADDARCVLPSTGGKGSLDPEILASRVDPPLGRATRILPALALAASLAGDDRVLSVVLHSDGCFHDVAEASDVLGRLPPGCVVDVVFTPGPQQPDLLVASVSHPGRVPAGEAIPITVVATRVAAPYATDRGEIRVSEADRVLVRASLARDEGSTRRRLLVPLLSPGLHRLTVSVHGTFDERPGNDRWDIAFLVGSQPRGLVVTRRGVSPRSAVSFRSMGWDVDVRSSLPSTSEELLGFDVVVLEDPSVDARLHLPATSLDLAAVVQKRGTGLLVLAGPESLGAGGWIGTPLERVLPVLCRPPGEGRRELVLLLDSSGSMADGRKMEIARESVRLLLDKLERGDVVAILPFTEIPLEWIGPATLGEGGGEERILRSLHGLAPGGGTRLAPALAEVARSVLARRLEGAHVLIVSDGIDALRGEDRERLLASARTLSDRGSTLSALITGEGGDEEVLSGIVTEEGRVRVRRPSDLSDALLLLALRTERRENDALALVLRDSAGLPFPVPLPPLYGLVRSTPREEATVCITTFDGDPVVVLGRAGAATTAVVTTLPGSPWAPDLGDPALLAALIQRVRGRVGGPSPSFRVDRSLDGQVVVRVELETEVEAAAVEGEFLIEGRTVRLPRVGPGIFEGRFSPPPGADVLLVGDSSGGAPVGFLPLPSLPALEERQRAPRIGFLEDLARGSSGRMVGEDSVLSPVRQRAGNAARTVLLLIALGLLLAGVAGRLANRI